VDFYKVFLTDLDFLVRGLAFVFIGAAFLLTNIFLTKRIKKGVEDDADKT
jgi:hypothetical protein